LWLVGHMHDAGYILKRSRNHTLRRGQITGCRCEGFC
jgi:hypothetical protein